MPEGADVQSDQESKRFTAHQSASLKLARLVRLDRTVSLQSCVWTFSPHLRSRPALYKLFWALNASSLPSGSQRCDAWLRCNLRRPLYWKYSSTGHMSVKSPQLSTHWPAVSSVIYMCEHWSSLPATGIIPRLMEFIKIENPVLGKRLNSPFPNKR